MAGRLGPPPPHAGNTAAGGAPLALGVWLLLLLILLPAVLPSAAAQMETPLKGQGSPGNETTEVFLSVYLDRLLEVDDTQNYRFSAVLYFYLTWRDPSAHATIAASTQRMGEEGGACHHPCTDWVDNLSCCDGIYTPTFFFRNAFAFPQDRAIGQKLYALPPPNGSVLWAQYVQGQFYQPMDLRHYPFDSFDLLVTLEFLDTSLPGHPGVTVRLSSAGKQLYTYGRGDAVSQWGVAGLSAEVLSRVDSVAWFHTYSDHPSHPDDPLGLTTTSAALLRGAPPGATSMEAPNPVTMVAIKIRIKRFWKYHLLHTALPILLLGLLSFVVFFLEVKELATRLGVVVTLFLAMAAVQFVVSEHQPDSSYILPTQQLALATYCLLALIAAESILVHSIATWKQAVEAGARRRQARDRYLSKCRAQKDADAAAAKRQNRCSWCLPTSQRAAPTSTGASTAPGPAGAAQHGGGAGVEDPAYDSGVNSSRVAARQLTRSLSLSEDAEYDEYVAWLVDRASVVVLLLGYCLTAVLIFTLQSGYIDLFA